MIDRRERSDQSTISTPLTRRGMLRLGGGALVAAALAACGDDAGGDEAATGDEPVSAFTLVAESMQWDKDRVVVAAGQEVTATIENRDKGMPHNLHIEAPGDPKTELEDGIITQTLVFTIDEPGEHRFVCDAHPNMTGTIVVV